MFRTFKTYFATAFVAASLVACGGGDDGGTDTNPGEVTPPPTVTRDSPGKIAGLGNTPGAVEGTRFTLPDGIKSTATWDGLYVFPTVESLKGQATDKTLEVDAGEPVDQIVGTGYAVTVRVPLENTTDQAINVKFPAGLVVLTQTAGYQNGVLLNATIVNVKPRSKTYIGLTTYCGNQTRSGSMPEAKYDWGVVSNSSTLQTLISALEKKKINHELFGPNDGKYWDDAQRLQEILHKLTDKGESLNASDLAWINSLPNV